MKRIVICSDGTWSTPEQHAPTNVALVARTVLPTAPDGAAQVVFYDEGVGTANWLDRLVGGVTGRGVEKNIGDGYRFLVHNFEEGDEIYLFGYSRGAYTVRSLAGLARNAGVLRKAEADRFREAYRLYRRADAAPGSREASAFRAAHSREADITFVGVWDTVGALGIPLRGLSRLTAARHQFHDVELSRRVRHGYHALAIDERRRPFRAALWKVKPRSGQTVEQVWFPGVHADVGGGYADRSLADASLLWMVERASRVGLAFDGARLRRMTRPRPMGALHESRRGVFRLFPAYGRCIRARAIGSSRMSRMRRRTSRRTSTAAARASTASEAWALRERGGRVRLEAGSVVGKRKGAGGVGLDRQDADDGGAVEGAVDVREPLAGPGLFNAELRSELCGIDDEEYERAVSGEVAPEHAPQLVRAAAVDEAFDRQRLGSVERRIVFARPGVRGRNVDDRALGYHAVALLSRKFAMALTTPNDRTLVNIIAAYEREIMGPRLTVSQITRIAETAKRMLLDEIHSEKARG